jgi:hypothetical protein
MLTTQAVDAVWMNSVARSVFNEIGDPLSSKIKIKPKTIF